MFNELKTRVSQSFQALAADPLFYVTVDRDQIWERYLAGFDESLRQEHNCNACKSFLRQWGGIVAIRENKTVSLWDGVAAPEEYAQAIQNLRDYIHSLPITDIFLNPFAKCGTDKNLDKETGTIWQHFFIEVPRRFVVADCIDTLRARARDSKNVFKRGLDDLTRDASETVLELIGQNSLYRGKEFEGLVQAFLKLQKAYAKLPEAEKDAFCWLNSLGLGAVAGIRNTAIGTLLIDLSAGLELDAAVTKFERVVAPSNYKRPTALVTPKMVEQAKETLQGLGMLESLDRRYAIEADLSVNDVLFTYRPTAIGDVFAQVAKDAAINPRTFSKTEEISIEDFLANVVPTAKSISVLMENGHLPNFVSLLTAQDGSAPSLFKWDNPFSWSYTGGITDSIKERVKAAGGNVDGELRVSLSWHNYDDLDLHVHEPKDGGHIYFRQKVSVASGGALDVDMNARSGKTRRPVENIIWTNKAKMKEGEYRVRVHNYAKRETTGIGFTVQVECQGEVFEFEYPKNPSNDAYQDIVKFNYSKATGIRINGEAMSTIVSKEKWGLKTNQFHKVTKLLLSPNHWRFGQKGGNKHYFFILEGCKSDEPARPFFNEFLKPELDAHRKVFEILGGKVKVEDTTSQLSGVGFSETQRAHLIVQVEGKFNRTLKINF